MDGLLISLKSKYDYIIIDCGLQHELLTINTLVASDYCIIPIQARFLSSEVSWMYGHGKVGADTV